MGTRQDLQEAIDFAVAGKVRATVHTAQLEDINSILADMKKGEIEGRMVLQIASAGVQPPVRTATKRQAVAGL